MKLFVLFWFSQFIITWCSDVYPLPTYQLEMFRKDQSVSRQTRRLSGIAEHASKPLFEGMGTHYSFIWMDPYFDPAKSSTSTIKNCGTGKNAKCFFRQSYSEGSSWNAFKVKDKVWMGGPQITDVPGSSNWSLTFEFGCQESETGLFRTQNVDGIMGMSAAEDTLPYQLFNHKLVSTKAFAMCFKRGGGVLTLGGVDTSLHGSGSNGANKKGGELIFAKLLKPKGWYTVRLLDVLMRPPRSKDGSSSSGGGGLKSIGGSAFKYNAGKGTIVDSGTTDTYLPSAVAGSFKAAFQSIAGFKYSNAPTELSPAQYAALPTIVYRLEGLAEGSSIEIEVPPDSYVEALKGGKYAARVYLTEGSGAVLGANFMDRHNVVFDIQQMRLGFAPSDCMYKPREPAAAAAAADSVPASTMLRSGGALLSPSTQTDNVTKATATGNMTLLGLQSMSPEQRKQLKIMQNVDSLLPF